MWTAVFHCSRMSVQPVNVGIFNSWRGYVAEFAESLGKDLTYS